MSLPTKEEFYSNLTMESITHGDYKHTKRVWEEFGLQNLAQYHDLLVQSDTLLLPNIFKSFRSKCHEIYELDSVHFL